MRQYKSFNKVLFTTVTLSAGQIKKHINSSDMYTKVDRLEVGDKFENDFNIITRVK